ncbi:exopolysaccharide production repressor protein [Mesorhizobium sp. M4B.F.Ca.ET.049.02.1.2]|uniref:exopolysaccharide production repressor protein n=1 Tax=unclassified Mesorhizobium TaxID=325217 RepID=UPI0026AEDAA4
MGGHSGPQQDPERSIGQMYFPQFLVGMSATILVVLGWTYADTGSLWQALGWTFVAALVLQVGYFIAVLLIIYGRASSAAKTTESSLPAKVPGPFERDGIIHTFLSRLL